MVIKNTTNCDKNFFRQTAVMINSKDKDYAKKKLTFNGVGLVAGMVAVSVMSRQLASTGDYNIWIILPFMAICAACLYVGMFYLDKAKYNQIKSDYAAKGITSIDFEIDAEDITISVGGKKQVCPWTNIARWMEDANNFYLTVNADKEGSKNDEPQEHSGDAESLLTGDYIVISKRGFTQCSAKDMKQLCSAIMQARREES